LATTRSSSEVPVARAEDVEPDEETDGEDRVGRPDERLAERGGVEDGRRRQRDGEAPERVRVHGHRPDVAEQERPPDHPRDLGVVDVLLQLCDRAAAPVADPVQPEIRVCGTRQDQTRQREREPRAAPGDGRHDAEDREHAPPIIPPTAIDTAPRNPSFDSSSSVIPWEADGPEE
jgi:hypothetical protein